jgi:hypothetical protein
METIECPQCQRVMQIESTYKTVNASGDPVHVQRAHSTTQGSKIQCACGRLL